MKLHGTNYDKRRKLTEQDKEEIRSSAGKGISQSQLAIDYGVCRSSIHYILHPYKLKKHRAKQNKYKKKYYNTKKNTIAIKESRRRRKEIEELQNLLTLSQLNKKALNSKP
jgi:IS30 family transposase